MQEEFIYFLWQHRLLDDSSLKTTDGRPVQILKTGFRNPDSGPDFAGGRIVIDGQEWFGNVEMHVKSSDWLAHGHQHDPAYLNVILHVVWEHDKEIYLREPGDLPVLELSQYSTERYLEKYRDLHENLQVISCADKIAALDNIHLLQWKDRMLVDRLESVSARITDQLELTNGDWQEIIYRSIARAFGLKVNELSFEMLARSVPYAFIARYRKRKNAIEAVLFGQAGMLKRNFEEAYPILLQKEYDFWKKAFGFVPMENALFKYMRMHPSAFPDLRIAQLSALLRNIYPISDLIKPENDLEKLRSFLSISVHDYWKSHYRFARGSENVRCTPGKQTVNRIILHGIVPVMYAMGEQRHQEALKERAILLLENMEPEQNKIIRCWSDCGVEASNIAESQALIHCFKQMCSAKKCLSCLIGRQILMSDHYDTANI